MRSAVAAARDPELSLPSRLSDLAVSGEPYEKGRLGQGAKNVIAPGKRPLSSMGPTIILQDGKRRADGVVAGSRKMLAARGYTVTEQAARGAANAIILMPDAAPAVSAGLPQPPDPTARAKMKSGIL